MEYLAGRGVRTLATDSVSMGPLPDLAEPTHYAGLRHGMIWTESATGLGELPATGAFYCMIGPKHAGGPYSEGRAFAVIGDPLASRLIDAARNRRAADLSVTLSEELPVTWPGRGVGNHRRPYFRVKFGLNPNTRAPFETHVLDSQAGTHLVPPAYALPPAKLEGSGASPEVEGWLREYQGEFGPRGTSDLTAEKVSIPQTCGPARVLDVRHKLGATRKESWPASPEVTPEDIREHEKRHGDLRPGDIVIFRSGWSDRYLRPLPEGTACLEDPLNGKSEGWPAPGPEAILYLAGKGIRCVATDSPTLGGVDPMRALFTYWTLGGKGLAGVEFLTNLEALEGRDAYFLFAALKIRGCHGGPGRAIAFY
jgi:kynurenine formamidase